MMTPEENRSLESSLENKWVENRWVENRWVENGGLENGGMEQDSGPVVRPYTLTRGRTRPRGEALDLIVVVEATGVPINPKLRLDPEHDLILELSQTSIALADLASEIDLPVGVVRILVDDLRTENLVRVLKPTPAGAMPDEFVLKELLHGLRAL